MESGSAHKERLPMKAYYDALDREQHAWRALDGNLPGSTEWSSVLWAEWVDAVAQLNVQSARMMQSHPRQAIATPTLHRRRHRRNGEL
jgi:hypothetical protein